ncbi:MAG: helix-turn-helix domain-containing protein [Firmicutes bacterium]|nr:helix-turn-helix domain-containing protein [Bacillota bacterium]HPU00676.1 DUF4115 domain-containing protein [Bacillota bacterium]
MKELGELLRKARLERKLTLKDISEQTKIQIHYLEALEEGDFDKFPGEVYLKGALRNFADAVGLDPQEVLVHYRRLAGEPPAEEALEPPSKPPARLRSLPGERGPSPIYGLLVIMLLLVLGGYWLARSYLKEPTPQEPLPSQNESELTEPEAPPEPGGEAPSLPEGGVEIRVAEAESTARETVFHVANAERLELELLCTERCWIELRADGKEQFPPRNFQKGEKVTAGASEKIWIRLGNPRGVKLTLGGVEVAEVSRQKNAHNFLFLLQ